MNKSFIVLFCFTALFLFFSVLFLALPVIKGITYSDGDKQEITLYSNGTYDLTYIIRTPSLTPGVEYDYQLKSVKGGSYKLEGSRIVLDEEGIVFKKMSSAVIYVSGENTEKIKFSNNFIGIIWGTSVVLSFLFVPLSVACIIQVVKNKKQQKEVFAQTKENTEEVS